MEPNRNDSPKDNNNNKNKPDGKKKPSQPAADLSDQCCGGVGCYDAVENHFRQPVYQADLYRI